MEEVSASLDRARKWGNTGQSDLFKVVEDVNTVVKYKLLAYGNENKTESRRLFPVSLIGGNLTEINPNIGRLLNSQSLARHNYHLLLNFVLASLNLELCFWKENS